MKNNVIILFLLTSGFFSEAKEISNSFNKEFQKVYDKGLYSEGVDIIKKLEVPTSPAYKKNGKYRDSKNLYRWKIIFLYKTASKELLNDFFYYKNIGGEPDNVLLKSIESECLKRYLKEFEVQFFKLRKSELHKFEENLVHTFHYNLDSVKFDNYKDFKRLTYIKDNIDSYKEIDTFNIPSNLEQSYNSVYKYICDFNYKGNNVEKISRALTEPFKSEDLKIFSIITFIEKNIEYDYVLAGGHLYYSRTYYIYGSVIPEVVMLYGKTVCYGYSVLFNELCKYSNIKSGMIIGDNHAFNWVYTNYEYKILDITWLDGTTKYAKSTLPKDTKLLPEVLAILNNIHYPKKYFDKVEYIFIDHHFPYEVNDVVEEIGFSWESDEEFKFHMNERKKYIYKVFNITRLPDDKEYEMLAKITDRIVLKNKLINLGIIKKEN